MDITSLSREKIKAGLGRREPGQEQPRIIISPKKISKENFDAVCKAYSKIGPKDFKTVVVVESTPGSAEKKLAMPSFKKIETHLGEVEADDRLRNDFADEDDDFFINDNAFNEDVSLYHQLVMLQCTLDDFTVSHIQITDENSIIIKELAMALEEILALKNALLVCCCDLGDADKNEIDQISEYLKTDNKSGLMNYLNSGVSSIDGVGSFITGLLVAKGWGLNVQYEKDSETGSIQSAYAVMQNQPIPG